MCRHVRVFVVSSPVQEICAFGELHLRPPAVIDVEDTGGASSSHLQMPPAARGEYHPPVATVVVPRTSTLALSEGNKADVMAQMFVASMQHQQYLMKMILGIHLSHGNHHHHGKFP